MIKNICFLGYSKNKSKLISFLKNKKNIKLIQLYNKNLTLKEASKADLIISFGYKKIIKKKILKIVKRPIINLHISYLPFNRGTHPNYWSFIEKTPKGITIHEMDEKIDEGKIIKRKKIHLNKLVNSKNLTFQNTYNLLKNEIEDLFINNFDMILSYKYKTFKARGKGSYHKRSDLPKNFKNWSSNINQYLKTQ